MLYVGTNMEGSANSLVYLAEIYMSEDEDEEVVPIRDFGLHEDSSLALAIHLTGEDEDERMDAEFAREVNFRQQFPTREPGVVLAPGYCNRFSSIISITHFSSRE